MILIKIKYSKFHGNQNEIRNEEVDRLANRGAFLPETAGDSPSDFPEWLKSLWIISMGCHQAKMLIDATTG